MKRLLRDPLLVALLLSAPALVRAEPVRFHVGTFAARARVIEDLDALRPSLTADALGVDLRPVLTQLEDEFERLRLREEDLRARLAGLARIATDQFEQFLRAAHAGRLLTRLATDGDRR